jgi:hypothetical protein
MKKSACGKEEIKNGIGAREEIKHGIGARTEPQPDGTGRLAFPRISVKLITCCVKESKWIVLPLLAKLPI